MRVVVLVDLLPGARYHGATVAAVEHAAAALGVPVEVQATRTDSPTLVADLRTCDGVVIGPGTPYRSETSAWDVIRTARERGLPLVGT